MAQQGEIKCVGGVSRYAYGYRFRITRRKNGGAGVPEFNKTFRDSEFGSKEAALAAAKEYQLNYTRDNGRVKLIPTLETTNVLLEEQERIAGFHDGDGC